MLCLPSLNAQVRWFVTLHLIEVSYALAKLSRPGFSGADAQALNSSATRRHIRMCGTK
jgi:hypothetical protein